MPELHQHLNELLQEGSQLFQPHGQSLLVSAYAFPNWEQLRLLYLTDNDKLQQWNIEPVASDYDPATSKLYVAYTEQSYLQLRPLPPEMQQPARERMQACFDHLCLKRLPEKARAESWLACEPSQLKAAVQAAAGYDTGRVGLGRSLWLAHHLQQYGKPLARWLLQSDR